MKTDHTFDTPKPILATLSVPAGDIVCTASDTATTTVVITGRRGDRVTPEDAVVAYADGHLEVTIPRAPGFLGWLGSGDGPSVRITLPSGSRVTADGAYGEVRFDGAFAAVAVKTSMGDVTVGDSVDVTVKTAHGDIRAGRLSGHTSLTTSNGDIRVASIDGTAVCKSSNGSVRLESVRGDVRATTANGDVRVDDFAGTLGATTTAGEIEVRNARAGAITASTRFGNLTFGLASGTAVWVDAQAGNGKVRNHLETSDAPGEGPRLELRAQSAFGDIVLRRSREALR